MSPAQRNSVSWWAGPLKWFPVGGICCIQEHWRTPHWGCFTPATEAESQAESESEESSDLVWIGTTEATEAEAESEKKETLLILLTPIPFPLFDLHWIVTLLALPIPSLVCTRPYENPPSSTIEDFIWNGINLPEQYIFTLTTSISL